MNFVLSQDLKEGGLLESLLIKPLWVHVDFINKNHIYKNKKQ